MPRRFPDLGSFPGSFEELPFRQAHENWIQRAGLQPGVTADVVPIFPVLRSLEKCIQNLESLWR